MEIFVPDSDWNSHYQSPQEAACGYLVCGDLKEDDTFDLVRVNVIGKTTYQIVGGRAVPIAIATPAGIADLEGGAA